MRAGRTQPPSRESAHQSRQCDLRLESGQGGTEAVVRATAERHVHVRALPGELDAVDGRAPLVRVPVGGTEAEKDHRTRWHHLVTDGPVICGDPPGELDRRVEPEQLLDRVRIQARIGSQQVELVREGEQVGEIIADEVECGLVAGDVEQHDLRKQLMVAERVAVRQSRRGPGHEADVILGGLGVQRALWL